MNFLEYAHWFTPIRISLLKDHYISVYQARYATLIFEKYIDIVAIKENSNLHKTTLPHDMIFTNEDSLPLINKWKTYLDSIKLTTEPLWDILFIYYLQKRVYVLQYTIWKTFHQMFVKYTLRVWYKY